MTDRGLVGARFARPSTGDWMFRKAVALASKFTRPVIISRKSLNGVCGSGIGAYIVVNSDGWFVTAGHIIEQIIKLRAEEESVREHERKAAAIRADASLSHKDKQRALRGLGLLNPETAERYSCWWGVDLPNAVLTDMAVIPAVDLGIGRLQPFDPAVVASYPEFKDPTKEFETGASLCRLGFPFHSIVPTWDATKGGFELPKDALPVPFFPNEGIFTRFNDVKIVDAAGNEMTPPFPMRRIETSSPGLRGQSGGPIFDHLGAIWGVQCITQHLYLGFDCTVTDSKGKTHQEHQFMNLGMGVHPVTIFGLLDHFKVAYTVSKH
jgi:hypothetical protein